jgi:hypothetical protein
VSSETDTPVAQPASLAERLKASGEAHGVTDANMQVVSAGPGGREIMHDIAKEAGMTKEDYIAALSKELRHYSPMRLAIDSAALAVIAGAVGAATVPVQQFAKGGQVTWRGFAESAPKSIVVGAIFGGAAGVIMGAVANNRNDRLRRTASEQWDKEEAAWTAKEGARRAAREATSSPGK